MRSQRFSLPIIPSNLTPAQFSGAVRAVLGETGFTVKYVGLNATQYDLLDHAALIAPIEQALPKGITLKRRDKGVADFEFRLEG